MKWPTIKEFDIKERTILLGYMGSISHNTHISPEKDGIDDIDVMGIVVPPKEYFLGLKKYEQCDTWVDEYDIVIYEIRKFFNLLLKNNPNVLGLLWLRSNHYIKTTEAGKRILEVRDIFSSKQAYKSFTGYAYSQLHRMEHYAFEGYMGAKRKALVERFGYDTKNAAHLIRLLRMGMEFLSTGELNVFRHDAEDIIKIKKGGYTLDEIKLMAKDLFDKTEHAFLKSPLPPKPDEIKAEQLLVEIVKEYI